MVIPNLPSSENGRLRRDGSTVPNQTQNVSKQQVSFRFILAKTRFQLKNMKTSPVLGNKDRTDSITMAARANSPRFQNFANENEDLSKVCQTIRLLELKVRQAFQSCQACRLRNLAVSQTQILSLPSLPFSGLTPIKHTQSAMNFQMWEPFSGSPGIRSNYFTNYANTTGTGPPGATTK